MLAPEGSAARAVLFSPHPEMGDLLRKWIALDGYVRKYLPIRGPKVMQETLRFYCADELAVLPPGAERYGEARTLSQRARRNTEHEPDGRYRFGESAIDRLTASSMQSFEI